MPRPKFYERTPDRRSARLFVIACEGEATEAIYFRAVTDGMRKVIVRPLPATKDGDSSPEHVIDRMNEFLDKADITPEDTDLWLVMDVDHRSAGTHLHNLHKVLQQAHQRGYQVAMSNPCIELWLLLHIQNCNEEHTSKTMKSQLRAVLPGFSETKYDTGRLLPHIQVAIERARSLDVTPRQPIPPNPGTRVYRLVQAIFDACGLPNIIES